MPPYDIPKVLLLLMTLLKMPIEGVYIVEQRLIKAPPWMRGQPVGGKFSTVGGFHRNLNSKPTRRKNCGIVVGFR